ncbi:MULTISPECIES: cell wall elongation regulator TseB-like domain-containing protein [Bacillaceae]|uniref:cell wall elongation regulator TseB-like domain-containing protein n=1 Tax=Bacillaceae TaxID=186817 RepID=UPI000BFBABF6|nr:MULTISPECIES: DUF5590 domain-containing protein [Bacillaceae]PGT87425.1 hypothetical protein COD11_07400 [Bacillus sp. AFS040349]UGB29231.1 DUF5590 domain-containing protein [Metabacillus sp. B2-18]
MGRKTWIFIAVFSVIFIAAVWIFTATYQAAREQYTNGHEQSKKKAMESANLSTITEITTFNSDKQYHVLTGEKANNEGVYVWVYKKEKEDKMLVKKRSSGITLDEAIKIVNNEYDPSEIISVQLGMDEEIPIWEVKYKDKSDRYTFDYVNFYDGEIIKHMALKTKTSS